MRDNNYSNDEEYPDCEPYQSCPVCGRDYSDIDFDYQSCSKCGYNVETKKFEESIKPTDEDFMNGDADIITGQWL